jgi:excisionase family DNA binding protein
MLNYTKSTYLKTGKALMQLRDAAEALGVHYQTAYAWVRQGVLPARKTGRGYEVSEGDVSALAARRASGTAPRSNIRVRDWTAQADRLHAAIMSGDETLARHIFDRLAHGVPLTELCERVISPALYRIGEDWAGGDTTIAAEHRASAICERLIAARTRQPQGRPRGIAVVSTPPGERHGLPALMATACLREDRWLVHHLASDLPVAEVTGLAGQADASLVVLSSATTESARRAREETDDITRPAAGLHVLTGQPGDPLSRLRLLARATTADGGAAGSAPGPKAPKSAEP